MFEVPVDTALVYLLLLAAYWRWASRRISWRLPVPKPAELHSDYCWRHVMFRLHWLVWQVAVAAGLVLLLAWDAEISLAAWFRPLSLLTVFVTSTTACWCFVGYLWFLKVWLFEPTRRH